MWQGSDMKFNFKLMIIYLLLAFLLTFNAFPFLWCVICSFQTDKMLRSTTPHILPYMKNPFINYEIILLAKRYTGVLGEEFFDVAIKIPRAALNSLIVSVTSSLIGLGLSSLSAYTTARTRFKLKSHYLFFLFGLRLLPIAATIAPLYILFRSIGLINTIPGLILVYSGILIPVTRTNGYAFASSGS